MKRVMRLLGRMVVLAFCTVSILGLLYIGFVLVTPYDQRKLPALRDGDIVFQSINTSQTLAIMLATHSIYSHVGVVHVSGGKPMVIEAVGPVREIPLDDWVRQGVGNRVTVGRIEGLSTEQGLQVVEAAKRYLGKPYDFFFLDSDDEIYCSELVHKAFRDGIGMQVGREEKVGDLSVNNFAVREVIQTRWKNYPPCKDIAFFDECYAEIMGQVLVSPESQRRDSQLHVIYSNFSI